MKRKHIIWSRAIYQGPVAFDGFKSLCRERVTWGEFDAVGQPKTLDEVCDLCAAIGERNGVNLAEALPYLVTPERAREFDQRRDESVERIIASFKSN